MPTSMNAGSCKLQVRSDESSNEIGRDALEVDVKLTDGKIGRQELFMNTAKQAQEVTNEGPHAFKGIDMDFTNAIPIVIARPFFEGMTDCRVRTVQVVVALPFIRVELSVRLRVMFAMSSQCLAVGVFDHA